MSLPSRERGLKSKIWKKAVWFKHVAPLAGAWIEIIAGSMLKECVVPSLPSRERGLKYLIILITRSAKRSLPSRERGLKLDV